MRREYLCDMKLVYQEAPRLRRRFSRFARMAVKKEAATVRALEW